MSILMGRSEVFAAMLGNTDLLEGSNSVTTIKDIGPEPLYEMLRFLYTDQVSFETNRKRFFKRLYLNKDHKPKV
jgi:hypothetical protein